MQARVGLGISLACSLARSLRDFTLGNDMDAISSKSREVREANNNMGLSYGS